MVWDARVPRSDGAVEVRVVGHVAGDGGIVAEDLVFDDMLARFNSVEKIGDVVGGIVIATRSRVGLRFGELCGRCGMRGVPFFQILALRFGGPAVERVAFGLGRSVLRRDGKRVAADHQRGFAAIEGDGLAGGIVLVTVHVDRDAGIVVEGGEQVGVIAPIVEVREAAGGVGARRNRIDAADTLIPGEEMDKQVARNALAVVLKAAPAEEARRIEGNGRRIAQPGIPVDGGRAGVGCDGVDPCTGRRVAVGVALDVVDLRPGGPRRRSPRPFCRRCC